MRELSMLTWRWTRAVKPRLGSRLSLSAAVWRVFDPLVGTSSSRHAGEKVGRLGSLRTDCGSCRAQRMHQYVESYVASAGGQRTSGPFLGLIVLHLCHKHLTKMSGPLSQARRSSAGA